MSGNSKKKGNVADQYNDWANYFNAKKAKQTEQFNQTAENKASKPQIFEGITIYINGYTNPPDAELRTMFISHGGQYSQYFGTHITFVIATNLPMAKKKLMWHKTLKPEWITESINAREKLDPRNYALYTLAEQSKQQTLSQVVGISSGVQAGTSTKSDTGSGQGEGNSRQTEEIDVSGENTILESSSISHAEAKLFSPSSLNANDTYLSKELAHESKTENEKSLKGDIGISTTADANFLQDFYNNSRLHLISTMKKDTLQMVAEWRRNISNHKFDLLQKYKSQFNEESMETSNQNMASSKQIIMHIDLDCFFVAVARMSRPHLIGKPVVVTHSKGTGAKDSKSDIACASYEARAKGVKAGMWLDEVKRLCPEVSTVPYDFEAYKSVSKLFFEAVASLSLDIEPISCDELYLNATKVIEDCRSTPVNLANFLRTEIEKNSKALASIGIGFNKLSARIATSLAKENMEGIRMISEDEIKSYISKLPIRKLPGIGYATAEKLYQCFQVDLCEQLQKLTLEELKQTLGVKTGEKLYGLCRGIDNDAVNCEALHQAKSVSAGCSFGVRFNTPLDMSKFIKDIAIEVSKRAEQNKCYGVKLTLSLWIVRKGFEHDPVKPGGHGAADVHSRTRTFMTHTRDINVIFKTSSELARTITLNTTPVNHIRGVRISLDQLKYEADMSDKEKKSVQNTLHSSLFQKKPAKRSLELELLNPENSTVQPMETCEKVCASSKIQKSNLASNDFALEPVVAHDETLKFPDTTALSEKEESDSIEPFKIQPKRDGAETAALVDLKNPDNTKEDIEENSNTLDPTENVQKPLKSCLKPFIVSFDYRQEINMEDEANQSILNNAESSRILNRRPSTESNSSRRGPRVIPPLNGITEISEIKYLISFGVQNLKPVPNDICTIRKYLKLLIRTKFLKEAKSLITYLWSLLPSLKASGGEDHLTWYDEIYQLIVHIELKLHDKFGGVFVLPSLSSGNVNAQ